MRGGESPDYMTDAFQRREHDVAKKLIERPGNRHFYPWPLILVSCVDEDGKPNIITIGASSVCCAHPWVIGFAMGVGRRH